MLLKLSTLAVVALLGFQTHAQLTVADVVDDIEKIDEVYDEAIDYLTSHGPDSADFNSVSQFLFLSNLYRKAN